MATSYYLLIFAVNMQNFKKDMKRILCYVLKFQIVQGATLGGSQLAPSEFNLWGGGGGGKWAIAYF